MWEVWDSKTLCIAKDIKIIKIVIPLIYACCKPKKKIYTFEFEIKINSYILKATFFFGLLS
jgi:hypothetical protein